MTVLPYLLYAAQVYVLVFITLSQAAGEWDMP